MTTKRPLPPTSEHEDDQQTKRLKLVPPSTPNTNTQHQYDVPVTTESFAQTTTTTDQQYPSDIDLPASLNSIKEFIIHKDNNNYIPLMSTIPLNKRRHMLYLPLEFREITLDGQLDSGVYINAMS